MFRGLVWIAPVGMLSVACGSGVDPTEANRGSAGAGAVGGAGGARAVWVGRAGGGADSVTEQAGATDTEPQPSGDSGSGGDSEGGAPPSAGGSAGSIAGASSAGQGGAAQGGSVASGGASYGGGGANSAGSAGSPAGGGAGGAPCTCSVGACCDGCNLRPSTYRCGTHLVHKAKCPPEGPSHSISYQFGDLFCSGTDSGECTRWVDTTYEPKSCPGNDVCHNPLNGTPYCGPL